MELVGEQDDLPVPAHRDPEEYRRSRAETSALRSPAALGVSSPSPRSGSPRLGLIAGLVALVLAGAGAAGWSVFSGSMPAWVGGGEEGASAAPLGGTRATSRPTSVDASEEPAATYVIAAGDTLAGIAQEFGTTVDALASLNELEDPDSLRVGDIIKLPR